VAKKKNSYAEQKDLVTIGVSFAFIGLVTSLLRPYDMPAYLQPYLNA